MKSREVLKNIGISRGTLVKYVKEGIIKTDAKINGQYVYNDESVFKLIGCKKKKYKRINITYARCSNPPKKYVSEQSIRILNFCSSKGIQIEKQIEDIKSGMNFDRDGLNELLKLVIENKVELIIIENKDRLVRFGFELLENIFKYYGAKIIIVNDLSEKSYEQELTEDLISIIHYFSMKSFSHRRKLNKIKKELELNANN
jgi:predicted site-specific integrase-resolvase